MSWVAALRRGTYGGIIIVIVFWVDRDRSGRVGSHWEADMEDKWDGLGGLGGLDVNVVVCTIVLRTFGEGKE